MSTWIEHSARRLVIAGALAFAVGAPTIACMGGDSTSDEAGGGDEGGDADEGGDDDGGGEEQDAKARALGNWTVVPAKEDARKLKIISMGLQPKSTEERLKKTLKPPPTAEELTMYREVKKVDPKSPEAQFLKLQIKMMKDSNLEISESKWVLEMGDEKDEWSYTVQSSSADELVVKLDSGETNTLTFVKDDMIKVNIKDDGGEMDLRFKRK